MFVVTGSTNYHCASHTRKYIDKHTYICSFNQEAAAPQLLQAKAVATTAEARARKSKTRVGGRSGVMKAACDVGDRR